MPRTQEVDRQNIIELYRTGIGSNAVAEKTGFCQDTVLRTLRKCGENVKAPNLPPTDEVVRRMIEDYRAGLSIDTLTIKYRSGPKTVMRILREARINRSRVEARQIYVADWSFFAQIDTPQKAYALGFLWADGHNHTQTRTISMSLQGADRYILGRILGCMKSNHPIKDRIRTGEKGRGNPYSVIAITNARLSQDLLRLGMVNDKTYHPQWPLIPEELERHFIRGFFDGDGCWYLNYHSRHFNGEVNFTGHRGFLDIVASKIKAHTGIIFRRYEKHSPMFGGIAKSGKGDMIAFGQWIYENADGLYLERKHRKYLETIADER